MTHDNKKSTIDVRGSAHDNQKWNITDRDNVCTVTVAQALVR